MADIFISHSSADKELADMLCRELEQKGLKCWIAPRDIIPGSEWAASISNAISESGVFLLIYSRNSAASTQVPKEMSIAEKRGVFLIPYKIDDTELSGAFDYFLTGSHWITANPAAGDYKIDELYGIVSGVLQTRRRNVTNNTYIDNVTINNPAPIVQPQQAMAQVQQAVAQVQQTIAQPTMAQAQPTMAQAQPTMAQAQPTMAQAQPTMAQAQPTMAQAQPAVAYATAVPAPVPAKKSNTGLIIGLVCGGVAIVIAIIIAIVLGVSALFGNQKITFEGKTGDALISAAQRYIDKQFDENEYYTYDYDVIYFEGKLDDCYKFAITGSEYYKPTQETLTITEADNYFIVLKETKENGIEVVPYEYWQYSSGATEIKCEADEISFTDDCAYFDFETGNFVINYYIDNGFSVNKKITELDIVIWDNKGNVIVDVVFEMEDDPIYLPADNYSYEQFIVTGVDFVEDLSNLEWEVSYTYGDY